MDPDRHFEVDVDVRRYEALLQMADLVVHHRGVLELLPELAQRLHKVASFEVASFSLYDPDKNVMRMHFWEGSDRLSDLTELPVEESACGVAWEKQQPMVWPDLHQETRFQRTMNLLIEKGVRSYCTLPLTTAQKRFGALGLGSSRPNAYGEDDVQLLRRVAELVALALENAMTRAAFLEEKERLEMLLEVSTTLMSNLDVQQLFPTISGLIRRVIRQDYASVALYEEASRCLRVYALDSPLADEMIGPDTVVPIADSASGSVFLKGEAKVCNREDLVAVGSPAVMRMLELGLQSFCSIPLITRKGKLGTLNLGSATDHAFAPQDISFLKQVAAQMAIALDNARAYREIAELTDKLRKEKLYLQDEIRSVLNFEEIVGESPALKHVLTQVNTVAPLDATVLILGETGTGKELIARAIHRMSSRKDGSFIKLNCAAIPTGLLESELFGHEKGAFTGAISAKIGRLELADKGTLFLDEVGDIPLELQPKLLRVLQDQEFERLGGVRTIRVNIRLIAATNRDLAKSVAAREFRSDLYYRLHVFPVHMPPLREREKDIELLVRYFVQKFSRRMNKQIETIPTETMNALARWEWPGNVRELENFIERSVILSEGTILNVPLSELRPAYEGARHDATLDSLEREHILRVLRESGGVVAGLHGAAARLGMKRTTLQSRMQKMGITRQDYEN
ncbi:MAG TPA: sigma 54-interacting transcriptional regulator [Terriglobales bacterium]|nr:sigma 54-interacting transcriptional regulator [Terriglobales bacterium]